MKQSRKTKPKGNHLKNLPNRIELKTDYEEQQEISKASNSEQNKNIQTKSIFL